MADAVEIKESKVPAEEVTSTDNAAKESPKKKAVESPAKKAVEVPASNGTDLENGSEEAAGDEPKENGDAEETNGATKNGASKDKKETSSVKRKSCTAETEAADVTTPEKKAKVVEPAEEAPEEVAA